MMVLGAPTFIWAARDVFFPDDSATVLRDSAQLISNLTRAGVLISRTGIVETLPRIPTMYPWAWPALVRTGSNQFRVFWGEDTVNHDQFDAQRMWSATFDGVKWGKPEPVPIGSGPVRVGFPVPDNRVAIPAFVATQSQQLNLRVGLLKQSSWSVLETQVRPLLSALSALAVDDGMVVLLIGMDKGIKFNTMKFTITPEHKLTAGPLQQLDSGTEKQAAGIDAKLLRLGADSVLAIWTFSDGNQGGPRPLNASLSPDGGITWAKRTSIELADFPGAMRAVRDANGIVHIVFSAPDAPVLRSSGLIRHVTYADGRWSNITDTSNHQSDTQLILGATDKGVMLSWGEGAKIQGRTAPRSYAAWWEPACSR
jgi:hypothetical protein